jgi:alkylhydroperoxidase family enzyme
MRSQPILKLTRTRTPRAIVESDLEPLRAVGLSDRRLHDLVAVVAYFNFVNRVATGLGVELEASP